jgi:hypothetical protein
MNEKKGLNENSSASAILISVTIIYPLLATALPFIHPIPNANASSIAQYVAGASSPLVFVWLLYGYSMQRTELQLQRGALIEQRQEFERFASSSELRGLIERASLQPDFTSVLFETGAPGHRPEMHLRLGVIQSNSITNYYSFSEPDNTVSSTTIDKNNNILVSLDQPPVADPFQDSSFSPDFRLFFVYKDMTGLITRCKFGNGFGFTAQANGDVRGTKNGRFQLLDI